MKFYIHYLTCLQDPLISKEENLGKFVNGLTQNPHDEILYSLFAGPGNYSYVDKFNVHSLYYRLAVNDTMI